MEFLYLGIADSPCNFAFVHRSSAAVYFYRSDI